jgi:hypothetical protein
LHIVESQRHSILHEDIDNTHAIIIQRLSEFVASTYSPVPLPVGLLPQINASFLRLISPLFRGRKNDEDKEAVNRS